MASNKVDYFEIGTPDPAATTSFYSQLFGWEVGDPSPQGYRMVNSTEGGLWDTSQMGGDHWGIFYVHVENVEDTVKRAESLGAKIIVPITSSDELDFAHLVDAQGNRFGVWHPKPRGSNAGTTS